jgi:hypothetical protein
MALKGQEPVRSKIVMDNEIMVTPRAALKYGREAWVLKKREEQRLEAAQIKSFRHLLGITKLDKE